MDAEAASEIKFIRRRVSQQINAASAPLYQMRTAAKTDSATKHVSSLSSVQQLAKRESTHDESGSGALIKPAHYFTHKSSSLPYLWHHSEIISVVNS